MERKRPFRLNLGITTLNLILFCHQGSSLSFVTVWSSLDFVKKKKEKNIVFVSTVANLVVTVIYGLTGT